MSAEKHPNHLHEHFARIRRAKFFLRFMPRRAVFHKYPLVGRFAAMARKRAYLWSFRTSEVRPAIYVGSIIAFTPLFGLHIPLAFVFALLLRANVMVLGGLQLLTNAFTVAPAFYVTYQVGTSVIEASGFGRSIEVVANHTVDFTPPPSDEQPSDPSSTAATKQPWTQDLGTHINALFIGGLIVGVLVGAIVDVIWRLGARSAARHRIKLAIRRAHAAKAAQDSS